MSNDKVTAYLAEVERRVRQREELVARMEFAAVSAPEFNAAQDRLAECAPVLLAAVRAGLGLHQPHRIYDECGHDHYDDEPGDLYRVDEIGLVCSDGFRYRICRECCTSGEPNFCQTEECVTGHGHGEGRPICRTWQAMAGELLGEDGTDVT